jgi:HEAT repeat protein
MKCQACDKEATSHVTEIVAGSPVEYHVCDAHLQELDALKPADRPGRPASGIGAFMDDPGIREALRDREAREKVSAYLIPPLCLALLDQRPEVRIVAAFRLMVLGPDARSATGGLRDATRDPDERVRKAAEIALEHIQHENVPVWFL